MSPEEIKRKTQSHLATGRENKDYDPQLAARVKKAFSRKYGESDPWFDEQMSGTPASSPAGNDIESAFRADPAMKGYTLGNEASNGFEVLDSTGKLVGHWTR